MRSGALFAVAAALLVSGCLSDLAGTLCSPTSGCGDELFCDLTQNVCVNACPESTQLCGRTCIAKEATCGAPPDDAGTVKPDAAVVDPGGSDASTPPDAGMLMSDASLPPDAAMLDPDAAVVPDDASVLPPDAATIPPDAAYIPPDAAYIPPDAAYIPPDAAYVPPDAAYMDPPDAAEVIIPDSGFPGPPDSGLTMSGRDGGLNGGLYDPSDDCVPPPTTGVTNSSPATPAMDSVCYLDADAGMTSSWCWESPALTANNLNAVWGRGPNDVYAVGDRGLALHYDGIGWSQVKTGVTANLMSVSGDTSEVLMAGGNGVALSWDGSTLSQSLVDTTATDPTTVLGVHVSCGRAWAVGPLHGVFYRPSPASAWSLRARNPPVSSTQPYFAVTTFTGDAWTAGSTETDPNASVPWNVARFSTTPGSPGPAGATQGRAYVGIWGASPTDIWAVGSTTAEHFDGITWSQPAYVSTAVNGYRSVHGISGNDLWIGHSSGSTNTAVAEHVANLTSSSVTWSPGSIPNVTPGMFDLRGIWAAHAGEAWAVGPNGLLLHWTGGANWSRTPATVPYENYTSVILNLNRDPIAAAGTKVVHRTSTGWRDLYTTLPTGVRADFLAGANDDDLWVAGTSYVGYYGQSGWISPAYNAGVTIYAAWSPPSTGAAPSTAWLGASGEAYFKCSLNGSAISCAQSTGGGTGQTYRAISGLDDTHVWAVGDKGLVADLVGHSSKLLSLKMVNVAQENLVSLAIGSSSDGWAGGSFGSLVHFSGGSSWTAASTSALSPDLSKLLGTNQVAVKGLWYQGSGVYWGVLSSGQGIRFDGTTWSLVATGVGKSLNALTGFTSGGTTTVYAVGDAATAVRYQGP